MKRLAADTIPAIFRLAVSYAEPSLPKTYKEWQKQANLRIKMVEVESFAHWVEERGNAVAERFTCQSCRKEIAAGAKIYADKLREDAPRFSRNEQARFKTEELNRLASDASKQLDEIKKTAEQAHGDKHGGEQTANME